jgi:hypothetical protein
MLISYKFQQETLLKKTQYRSGRNTVKYVQSQAEI